MVSGKGDLPKVKYVGNGTVIMPRSRALTSSSDWCSPNRSPVMIAREKLFFDWTLLNLLNKSLKAPLGPPITTLIVVRMEIVRYNEGTHILDVMMAASSGKMLSWRKPGYQKHY